MGSLVELLIIAVLIGFNGVFVAAEIALVTVRRSRIRQLSDEGDRRAKRVARMTEKPAGLLATIQLGITFIGFLAAAFAGASIAGHIADWLREIGLAGSADIVALLIVTLMVSVVTIVFGELVPKTLALAHAERYALTLSRPVEVLGRVLGPVVWFLTTVTHGVTRMLGVRDVSSDDAITSEELLILVERGSEQGTIEAEEEQMIGGVLELGEQRAHEVMVARVDMVALEADASLAQIVDVIVGEGHSRIPVYEGNIDNIIGMLYAKDLLPYLVGEDLSLIHI